MWAWLYFWWFKFASKEWGGLRNVHFQWLKSKLTLQSTLAGTVATESTSLAIPSKARNRTKSCVKWKLRHFYELAWTTRDGTRCVLPYLVHREALLAVQGKLQVVFTSWHLDGEQHKKYGFRRGGLAQGVIAPKSAQVCGRGNRMIEFNLR